MHYKGWDDAFDEWVAKLSARLWTLGKSTSFLTFSCRRLKLKPARWPLVNPPAPCNGAGARPDWWEQYTSDSEEEEVDDASASDYDSEGGGPVRPCPAPRQWMPQLMVPLRSR